MTISNYPLQMRTTRDVFIRAIDAAGGLRQARNCIAQRGEIIVLTLHRIVPDAVRNTCFSPAGMVLSESIFARLIGHLNKTATFVSPDELDLSALEGNAGDRGRPRILLTFDDGWLDNWTLALPYLLSAKIKACFFVATALIGCSSPFWPERVLSLLAYARHSDLISIVARSLEELVAVKDEAAPSLKSAGAEEALLDCLKQFPTPELLAWIEATWRMVNDEHCTTDLTGHELATMSADSMEQLMTWDQLRTLVALGHRIGSHTCTHAILPQLDRSSLNREIIESRSTLQEQLPGQSQQALWISYPNGSSSPGVLSTTREAGYQCGFSNSLGTWRSQSNLFLVPRVNVWDGTLVDSSGAFSERNLNYSLFWRTSRANADH